MNPAKPINPQRVFWELSPRPPRTTPSSAPTRAPSRTGFAAANLKIRPGMMGQPLGQPGDDVPGRAVCRGGEVRLSGPRCRSPWSETAPCRCSATMACSPSRTTGRSGPIRGSSSLVLNNGDLNMVTWEMRVLEGNPKFRRLARHLRLPLRAPTRSWRGLRGYSRRQTRAARRGLGRGPSRRTGPSSSRAVTDPDVPPLAARHISLEASEEVHLGVAQGRSRRGGDPPPELHRARGEAPAAPGGALSRNALTRARRSRPRGATAPHGVLPRRRRRAGPPSLSTATPTGRPVGQGRRGPRESREDCRWAGPRACRPRTARR